MKRFVAMGPDGPRDLAWKGEGHEGVLCLPDGEWPVDVQTLDGLLSVKVGDRVHRVERLGPHRWRVDGRELDSRVLTELEHRFAGFGAGAEEDAALHLVVPMPGRVVKVLVQAGQEVAKGQGLVIVEAMKMENELKAPRAAVVAAVRVQEGQGVEKGTVLVDFA
jgi:acetyl/propionyl-CoA carboxylase alpha subunit